MIATFIDTLLDKNLPFACWFDAGGDAPRVIIDRQPIIINNFSELNNRRGFICAPFEATENSPIFLLKPNIFLSGTAEIAAFDLTTLPDCPSKTHTPPHNQQTTWQAYQAYVGEAITQLKTAKLAKVVLAKTADKPRGGELLGELLTTIKNHNSQVFVYLLHLPDGNLWLGATPEILLNSNGETAQTMSLAGTQARCDGGDYRWRAKEIEEQAFVSRYTVDTLNRYGIADYRVTGPEDFATGAVAHLKTTFHFNAQPLQARLGEFIADLSPTPAVCGLPKSQARHWIRDNEPIERGYYSGFLGAWRLHGEAVNLYVNIRCLQVFADCYRLYSGGGITAKSEVTAEWDETERKMQTLSRAIEQITTPINLGGKYE